MINETMPQAFGPADFATLPLPASLQAVVRELGYAQMTPIQAQSIPHLLAGKDLIGQSRTGSGKTAAFSLPLLARLDLRGRRLQALVLCPTRELCDQVAREIRRLGRRESGLQVLCLSGGQPLGPQLSALAKGIHVAVGTPGRILDHLGRGSLELGDVTTVVLDEADRMLDMGFQDDMEEILRGVPARRQIALFSATFPPTIEEMSRAYQTAPLRVTIADDRQPGAGIRQVAYEVGLEDKLRVLHLLLQRHRPESAIVFCNHKQTVADLTTALAEAGESVACLHGDLEQYDRDRVMAKFRNHSVRVLVATDVASRGLDVADLEVVFNFDLPSKPESYVHRIGRTGRAGKKGLAISLMVKRELFKLRTIEAYTGTSFERPRLDPSTSAGPKTQATAAMETLYISGGRKEKLRPGDILGALTGEAGGLSAADVGKIEIHDHFAYVAVARVSAAAAVESLRAGRIKGRKFAVEMVR